MSRKMQDNRAGHKDEPEHNYKPRVGSAFGNPASRQPLLPCRGLHTRPRTETHEHTNTGTHGPSVFLRTLFAFLFSCNVISAMARNQHEWWPSSQDGLQLEVAVQEPASGRPSGLAILAHRE